MLKHSILLAILLAGTSANAQVGPDIAYARGGGRAEIHLINSDGSTGHFLLYRGGPKSEIFHVDIKPGGGELAFEEHTRVRLGQPQISTIKVMNYDSNGVPVGSIRSLQLTCLTGSLDYHPTDGTLLYRSCSNPRRINRLNTATMVPTDLGLSHDAFIASWLDATHLLYWVDAAGLANDKFWTVSTDALTSPTEVIGNSTAGALDTSTSGNKGLWSTGNEVQLVDLGAPSISGFQSPGHKGHFSPDDQRVAYITGGNLGQGGQFILIRNFDGTGSSNNLVGRGSFTALDWRN